MKPTVSYVRGLRDVLEIPTKEERREYLIGQCKKEIRNYVIGASIAFGLPILSFVALKGAGINVSPLDVLSPTLLLGSAFVGAVPICFNNMNLSDRKNRISRAGRAFQNNIMHNTPVPSDLVREAF